MVEESYLKGDGKGNGDGSSCKLHGKDLEGFFCCFVLFLFTATSVARGRSWAGSQIGAAATAYTTATATPDLSHIYGLCHSLQQRYILNPLSEARD